MRDLTRTRTSLIDERSAAVNRIQKVLEDANIKLAGVATDIMGKSGRDILAALVGGESDAAAMADLARGKLRRKHEALEQALRGRMSDHHRMLIALHLEHVDLLDEQIDRLSADIAERLRPYEATLLRLETIPGVGRRTAEILAAEMGLDISQPRQYPYRTHSRYRAMHHGGRSHALSLWPDSSAPRCHYKGIPRAGLHRRPRGRA